MPRRLVAPKSLGCARRMASGLKPWAKAERGAKPLVHSPATARHSLASHPAAKPQRETLEAKTLLFAGATDYSALTKLKVQRTKF